MKQMYLGVKVVEAEPMLLEDFQAMYPGRVVSPMTDSNEGYCITYKDGYQGWCPTKVFLESYRVLPNDLMFKKD